MSVLNHLLLTTSSTRVSNFKHNFLNEKEQTIIISSFVYFEFKALNPVLPTTDNDCEKPAAKETRFSYLPDAHANLSICNLLCTRELRWPLITSIVLQCAQHLCGIHAVIFFLPRIFYNMHTLYPWHAIVAIQLIYVLATIECIRLIDLLGRKPLIVCSMAVMITDLIVIFVCLKLSDKLVASELSIACIVIFIACFAFGLGPIPFIYTAECFKQSERRSAVALCMFVNWCLFLVLALTLPFVQELLQENVFIFFWFALVISMVLLFFKVGVSSRSYW